MKSFHTSTQLTGTVKSISPAKGSFIIEPLTRERIEIKTSITTYYEVLRNIGDEWRDRIADPNPDEVEKLIGKKDNAIVEDVWEANFKLIKYIKEGMLISLQGVYTEHDTIRFYTASRIVLMHNNVMDFGWEGTHWWIQQIESLFEQWLDVLFGNRREITENDWAEYYRTNLDLLGGVTTNDIQESATLSRLLYGLSSSYLITANERSFSAVKSGVKFLINAFHVPNHNNQCIFWKHARKRGAKSNVPILSSQYPDDFGSYALYEQIYVLSGLTQYYRITQDTYVLSFITRTIAAFNMYFKDDKRNGVGYDKVTDTNKDSSFVGYGGYFSHIDTVTMRPNTHSLGQNAMRKNWNSIGDHIPAYLINLIISLDPLPVSTGNSSWDEMLKLTRSMLTECVEDIIKHFQPEVDKSGNPTTLFVKERFKSDWTPDFTWAWQQDRGIVGHNLKISWNLTRCGHYFTRLAMEADMSDNEGKAQEVEKLNELTNRCYEFAIRLGHNMKKAGVDLLRGGIFDALERHPQNGLETQFAWGATKDFWQQEQAILAYYIMQHIADDESKKDFLEIARYCSAFWSLFFVDQDYRKIYFRTSETGATIIEGQYGIQAGHAVAGYHAFELCYLAHIYIRTYVDRGEGRNDSFVLHYRPKCNSGIKTLNVMPDFFAPNDLKIIGYTVNGVHYKVDGLNQQIFQISIPDLSEDPVVTVEYLPIGRPNAQTIEEVRADRREADKCQVAFRK